MSLVLNAGHVELMEVQGSERLVARILRESRGGTLEGYDQHAIDRMLLSALRKGHMEPFESARLVIHAKMPLFVQAQWVRTRMAGKNQTSLRYSGACREWYQPTPERMSPEWAALMDAQNHKMFDLYESMVAAGEKAEVARCVLPVGTYTTWVWWVDLNNLLKWLALRTAPDAQWEIRQYAEAVQGITWEAFPVITAGWESIQVKRTNQRRMAGIGAALLDELGLRRSTKKEEAVAFARQLRNQAQVQGGQDG